MLPTGEYGVRGQELCFIHASVRDVAEWLQSQFGAEWQVQQSPWSGLSEVMKCLTPRLIPNCYACVPLHGWTAIMNNTIRGTDLGVLPSRMAKQLSSTTIRVVNSEPSAVYPARILAIYEPNSPDSHGLVRSIEALNDGGRWVFATFGIPYAFEDTSAYSRRLKRERFTSEMLYRYLGELGVPYDVEPEWAGALLVTTRRVE